MFGFAALGDAAMLEMLMQILTNVLNEDPSRLVIIRAAFGAVLSNPNIDFDTRITVIERIESIFRERLTDEELAEFFRGIMETAGDSDIVSAIENRLNALQLPDVRELHPGEREVYDKT
jgi:hypothetical protein